MKRTLYSELSRAIQARANCAELVGGHDGVDGEMRNPEWFDKHEETIEMLVKQHMPHGSGFDSGTKIDLDASHADKLVFTTSFHHMNDGGFYDGWTEHTVTVVPSLSNGFHMRIGGRNRNDIKEMMYQEFDYVLRRDVTYDLYREHCPEWEIKTVWENQSQFHYEVKDKQFKSLDDAREYAGEQMYAQFMKR